MKKACLALAMMFVGGSVALATDIDARVTDLDGNAKIEVNAGDTVKYKVMAVLTDKENEGLSLIGLTLSFSGGDLEPADAPTKDPMLNFTRNAGIDNPDGFPGTVIDGDLVQIGGGQNTIKNFDDPENPKFPIGQVIVGVAKSELVLVTGSLTAPQKSGEYTLELKDLFGTVIKKDETGNPFWRVDMAGAGELGNLIIVVSGEGCNAPKKAKFKAKFRKDTVKGKMKKYDPDTEYTVELFADENPDPVKSQAITTNKKGKAKPSFKKVECGPAYTIGTPGCGTVKVKRTCKP